MRMIAGMPIINTKIAPSGDDHAVAKLVAVLTIPGRNQVNAGHSSLAKTHTSVV